MTLPCPRCRARIATPLALLSSLVVLLGSIQVAPVSGQDAPATATAAGPVVEPLVPRPSLSSPNGPRILRIPTAAPGTVAMRLSVPIRETEIEAGSARVIAAIARSRIEGLVAPLGVEAEVRRTPWGIAYSVAGPETDFDYLAYILRELASLPELSRVEEARTLLRRERAQREETGRGRVELRLRTATAGTTPPILGTSGSIEAISPNGIREVWLRTHRPESMTLMVGGEVSTPLLLASFAEIGAREPAPAPPSSIPVPSGPTPDRLDLLRTSVGVAWSLPRPLSPEMAVIAVLLTEEVRASAPGFEARVLVWETPGRSTLGLIGVAFARDLADLRRWERTGLDRLEAGLDPARVTAVANSLRGDALHAARTPMGQLRSVGRFLDAGLGATAFRDYLDALAGLTPEDIRSALRTMANSEPASVEVTR